MNDMPLVTIGVINYNNSPFVRETLDSIEKQTYLNIELIIVDDCSTDDSPQIIEQWLQDYQKPFKFIKHDKNYGVCRTSNDALVNANGKYFSYVATDDILMPDKITKQVEIIERSNEDVCAVYSDAYLMNEDSSPRYGWFIQRYKDFDTVPSGEIFNELFDNNWIPAMSLLIKLSHIREVGIFDEGLFYEDYDMWLRLAKKYQFIFSNYVSCTYRIRKKGLALKIKWHIVNLKIYLKHIDDNIKALKKLEQAGYSCYLSGDNDFMSIVNKAKEKSKAIRFMLLLKKLNVPKALGSRIILKYM